MKRTQIYIDLPTYYQTKRLAALRGQTISQLIRTTLKKTVKREKKQDLLALLDDFHKKYPTPPGTPRDLSTRLDYYLYHEPYLKHRKK